MRRWRCTSNNSYLNYFKQDLMTPIVSQTEEYFHVYLFQLCNLECDMFKTLGNSHRIRSQQGLELPTGIPSHMFQFQENYCAEDESFAINTDAIHEAADRTR